MEVPAAGATGEGSPLAVQLPLPAHLIAPSGGRGAAVFPLAPGFEWELVVLLLPDEGDGGGGSEPSEGAAADVDVLQVVSNVARVSLGACALRVVAGSKNRGGRLAGSSLTEIHDVGQDLSPRVRVPPGSPWAGAGSQGGGALQRRASRSPRMRRAERPASYRRGPARLNRRSRRAREILLPQTLRRPPAPGVPQPAFSLRARSRAVSPWTDSCLP